MAKRVRVQVPEVLPVGKSLVVAVGIGFRLAMVRPKPEVVRFVGRSEMGSKSEHSKQAKSVEGQKMRTMPSCLVFRAIHRREGGSSLGFREGR